MIRILNAVSSAPVFPRDELESGPNNDENAHEGAVIAPDARAGERRSGGGDVDVVVVECELSESARDAVAARRTKKTERKEAVEETILRDLSVECIDLMTRMKRVPKYSPEWVLSKLEMKLVSEELRYLCAESIAKRARVYISEE